jgi:Arc/MetJ family transcription regulator
VRRKTALLIDDALLQQAQSILGTPTATATIEEALREVVRREGRARLVERLRRRHGLDLDEADG